MEHSLTQKNGCRSSAVTRRVRLWWPGAGHGQTSVLSSNLVRLTGLFHTLLLLFSRTCSCLRHHHSSLFLSFPFLSLSILVGLAQPQNALPGIL